MIYVRGFNTAHTVRYCYRILRLSLSRRMTIVGRRRRAKRPTIPSLSIFSPLFYFRLNALNSHVAAEEDTCCLRALHHNGYISVDEELSPQIHKIVAAILKPANQKSNVEWYSDCAVIAARSYEFA